MENGLPLKKGCRSGRERCDKPGQDDLPDILFDAGMHGLVGVEFVVLGRKDYGVDPDRLVLRRELDGVLVLRVRTQVMHRGRLLAWYFRKDLEEFVRKRQGERHVILRVAAGVTEHHSLVAGTLFLFARAHDAAVDVGALVVDGRNHPA